MDNNIKFSCNMRLPADNKPYWRKQLQVFANHFASMEVSSVQYGKQDMRGVPSITLVDHNHCVHYQRHFKDGSALLAFVEGYNMASKGLGAPFDIFGIYKKGAK